MAETKVSLDVEVKGVESSISSIKDLKNAIKDARNEQIKAGETFGIGSKQYELASKRVSELKDKVDDLSDSSKSLQGSGIERASQGFNQLGDGLRNLDFDKVKVGLTAIKTALAATGVMLIVQGVLYLIQNFDELSKGSGLLAKALRFVGDIITSVKDAVLSFTDSIGITNSALDKMGDATVENANKAKEALAGQTAEYDRQISIAKASGKSAVDLEKAKQQAIIDTNKALVEQTIAYVRKGGILSDEQKKLLTEQLNAIKTAKTEQTVIDITENKKQLEDYKKHIEEKKKLDKEAADAKRLREQQVKDDIDANIKREEDRLKKELEDERLAYENKKLLDIEVQDAKDARDKAARDKKRAQDAQDLADAKVAEAQKFQLAKDSLQATQQLTDLYFMFKSSGLKKGSKEEEELARKAFNVNKALQLSSATVSGIQSVQNAFTTASASPLTTVFPAYPFIQAGLAGVFSAANIAKIASAKFQSSASTPSVSTSTPSASIPAAPTINNPNANTNPTTQFDDNGRNLTNQPMKISIGVDEITKKSDRVDVLEKQSTF
jgi:hypothetical protein